MPVPEKLLNENGIFIEERPHRKFKGLTEDWVKINSKEYQTSYASYKEKTLTIWDGDEVVNDRIVVELNCR